MANVKISAFSTVSGTPPNINNMGGLAGYEGSANVQISGVELIASLETNLNLSNFTTGTLAVNKGGTGQNSYVNGELLIGNTNNNTLTKATLTAGANISITNGNGSITIASTDQHVGTVTSVTSGNTDTITIGATSAAPTVAANTATVVASGASLATGGQIATYVTGRKVTDLTAPTSSFDMNSQKITGLLNPTDNQEAATKNYVDTSVSSATVFQGDYDATTDPATGVGISTGFTYVVTVAGTGVNNFWSSTVNVGEFIIAKQDNPTSESNWTVVPSTVGLATSGTSSTAVAGKAGFDSSYFSVSGTGFTSLLTVSGLTSGTYNNANVTVDVKGRVTAIAAGTDNDTTYDLQGIGSSNTDSGIRLTDGTNNDDVLIVGAGSVTASQNNNTITLTGTDTTYTDFNSATPKNGLVPVPRGGSNSEYFLNEDGSWKLPSYTTYPLFYDTNNNPAAQNGLVPAPASNETTKFLKGDGTWGLPAAGSNTTYTVSIGQNSGSDTNPEVILTGSDSTTDAIVLTGGTDISVTRVDDNNLTIASTATGYILPLAADGTRGGIQIGATGLAAKEYAVQLSSEKAYVAVPWVNTTYSTFTYDSSTPASSTSGLVPAPITSGDNVKFLRGDATWVTPTDTTDNAAGTAGQLQYTTGSGVFAATSDMVYTTDQLKVQNTLYLDGNGPAGGGSGSAGIVKLGCEAAGASHYVGLEGPTHAGSNSYIIKFPDPDPAVGKILKVNSFSNDKAVMEWADAGGTVTESFIIAASDETTDLTTGTGKATFRIPYAFTLTAVRASVTTAPVGSVITVDINESGTSILSTKITIAAGSKTSVGGTAPVISDSALADDAEITIDIDTIGSSTAGTGLKVTLIGNQ